MCVCARCFPSLSVYIDIWGQLYRVCLLLRVRMWAFWDPFFLYMHFVISIWEWDKWSSPRGSGWLSFLSLHSLLMWLHSMFDLSWSSLFFPLYSLFRYHLCHCLWFIPFASPPCSFLSLTYSRFDIFLASFLCISLSVRFVSFVSLYYIHIGHS